MSVVPVCVCGLRGRTILITKAKTHPNKIPHYSYSASNTLHSWVDISSSHTTTKQGKQKQRYCSILLLPPESIPPRAKGKSPRVINETQKLTIKILPHILMQSHRTQLPDRRSPLSRDSHLEDQLVSSSKERFFAVPLIRKRNIRTRQGVTTAPECRVSRDPSNTYPMKPPIRIPRGVP